MARLEWGELPALYERGVDQGVLYLEEGAQPWNGIVKLDERDTGSIDAEHYYDGRRLHISQDLGDFEGTLTAFTYPDEFAKYNGYSETETYKQFGLSYRTEHGPGYRIHIVYKALLRIKTRDWQTLSNQTSPVTFDWDIFGSSVPVPGASPTSRVTIESASSTQAFSQLEDILYGTDSTEPRLPAPSEIVDIYEDLAWFRVRHGADGTYTVEGTDDAVQDLGDGQFRLNAPSVFELDDGEFLARSH